MPLWWSVVVKQYLFTPQTVVDCSGHSWCIWCCVVVRLDFIFVTEKFIQLESLWSSFAHTGKRHNSESCSGHLRTSFGYVNTIKIMSLEIGKKIRYNGKPFRLDCRGLEAALSAENDCCLYLPNRCINFPKRPNFPTSQMKWLPWKWICTLAMHV